MDKRELFFERLEKYKKNAEILRQIHSNKGKNKHTLANWHLTVTLILSAIISFIGFMGIKKLSNLFDPNSLISLDFLEFIYNSAVFLILILIIVELIFNFKNSSNQHYKSITILTGFIRDVDDLLKLQNFNDSEIDGLINSIRERYKLITEILPPSTDKEFLKSKIDYRNKKLPQQTNGKQKLSNNIFLIDPTFNKKERKLVELILNDNWMLGVIQAVNKIDGPDLWISGGFVRNKVWDTKHKYKLRTKLDDVDVVYYNQENIHKSREKQIENQLSQILPNINWSVKNQARMHIVAEDEPYTSLYDALRKWPETATAIALQIDENGFLKILAPYGYNDLFDLKVKPPDFFKENHKDRYNNRIEKKNWIKIWPKLKITKL
nr:nucleotidyltransferase family protein [uncultured Draconibacterium sp.]